MLTPPPQVDDDQVLAFFRGLDFGNHTVLVNPSLCTATEGASFFKWGKKYFTVWRHPSANDLKPL